MLAKGAWEVLAELRNPELKELVASLEATVLASRAPSTVSKYVNAFGRWKQWAQQYEGMVVLPVNEAEFALYLQHLGDTTASRSAVEEAVNGVSWVQQLAGFPAVTGSSFVGIVLDGLQRRLAKPKVKKEPVSTDMLSALVESLDDNPSLSYVRLAAACLLSFAAFLRYDELAKLRCCDITFGSTYMEVHIVSSKTDQYRQGDSVVAARSGSPTCPVAMLERYFSMATLTKESKLRLFRGIISTKNGERLRSQETDKSDAMESFTYPSFAVSERHRPWRLNNRSGTPAWAAVDAPPALRLCRPNCLASNPRLVSLCRNSSRKRV